MISLPTPILDPISGHLIKLVHHRLIIEPDFELTQEVRQEYWTNVDGEFGIPLLEAITLNPNLTEEQKARQSRVFAPSIRTATTRGHKINPATGELVYPDESGQWPEGAVDEKMMWISVQASDAPGNTLSEKISAMLIHSMQKMAERNRV